MSTQTRILIIEDLHTDFELAQLEIRRSIDDGIFKQVETRQDFLEALEHFQPDVILSDYNLPRFDGMTALKLAKDKSPLIPFIIWTGSLSEDVAVECMKAGADNYIIKENLKRLGPAVIHALDERQLWLERKQAEEQLRNSEARFATIFQSSPVAIGISRLRDGKIIHANPAFCRLLGYSLEDALGRTTTELNIWVNPADRQWFISQLQTKKYVQSFETSARIRSGSERYVIISGELVEIDGEPCTMAQIMDITERKQADEALQESHIRLEEAQELALIGNWEWDLKTDALIWSKEVYSIFGLDAANFTPTAKSFENAIHPDDRENFLRQRQQMLDEKQFAVIDHRIQLPTGEIRYVQERTKIFLDESGNVIRVSGTVQDISERKLAEEALQEAEKKYKALVEKSPIVVYIDKVDGAYQYMSPQVERMLGYQPEEFMEHQGLWKSIVHPEDLSRVQAETKAGIEQSRRVVTEYRLTARDGSMVWVHDEYDPIQDPQTGSMMLRGVFYDITRSKLAEEALRENEKYLRQAYDAAELGVWKNDLRTGAIQLDERAQLHYGLDRQDLMITDILACVHPEDILRLTREIEQATAPDSAGKFSTEYRVIHADGTVHWLVVGMYVTFEGEGEQRHAITGYGTTMDITARKLSELDIWHANEQARKSEEFLQNVQNALSAHIAILDEEGTIVQVNAAWRNYGQLNGLNHSKDGIGLNYLEICDAANGPTAEEAPRVSAAIRDVIAGRRKNVQIEYPCHSPTEKHWFTLRITRFNEGDHLWVVMAHENITDRKLAEETISDLARVPEENPNPILRVDRYGTILYANTGGSEWLDHWHVTVGNNLPNELKGRVLECFDKNIRTTINIKTENRLYSTLLVPIQEGGYINLYGRDMTATQATEEKLRTSEKRYHALFEDLPIAVFEEDMSEVKRYLDFLKEQGVTDLHEYFTAYPAEIMASWQLVKILEVNRAALEMYGADSKESLVYSSLNEMGPGELTHWVNEMQAIADGKTHYSWEGKDLQINGGLIDIILNWTVVPGYEQDYSRVIFTTTDITERKRTESRINELLTFNEKILDNAPIGILAYKRTGECIFANSTAAAIVGASVETLKSQDYRKLESWKASGLLDLAERAFARNEAVSGDVHIASTFGKQIWLTANCVRFMSNEEEHLLLLVTDITERKQAEEELRASEERFRQLADNIQEVFWMTNLISGEEIYFNPASEKVWGRSLESLLSTKYAFMENILPEDRPYVQAMIQEQRSGKKTEMEFRIRHPDGSIHWVWDRAFPIFDSAGNAVRVAGIAADITERKQAQDELRASEERFRQLADNIEEVFWMTDAITGEEIYISPASEKVWGRSLDNLLHDENIFIESILPEDRLRVQAALKAQRSGKRTEVEYRIQLPEGTVRWVWDRAFPVFDDSGKVVRVAGIAADITERREAEETLRRRETILEAVGFAAQKFLNQPDWRTSILDVLKRIGSGAEASRAYIFENQIDHEGALMTIQRYEWCAPGVIPQINNPDMQNFHFEENGFQRWVDVLSSNQVIHGHLRTLPQIEQAALAPQKILSILVVPIFVGQTWWGFLGYDACDIERDWHPTEIEALGAAASTLGAAIQREQVEEQLRKLSRAVEQSASTIVITDVKGKIEYANPKFTQTTGYTIEEAIGQNPRILKSEFTTPDEYAVLWKTITSGREWHGEFMNRKKSGELYWESATISPIFNERGEITHFLAVKEEITERKKNETNTQRHYAELQALYENGLAVGRLLDPHEIGERIISTFARYLSWHHVAIRLVQERTGELKLIAFNQPGLTEEERSNTEQRFQTMIARAGQGLTGWVAQSGMPLRTGNVHAHAQYVDTHVGIQSGLYMPLKVGDRILGVISVESEEPNAFTEQDERLLATLANQAVVALENARLYHSIQQELQERGRAESLMQKRFELMEYSAEHRLEELMQKTLDEISGWTHSTLGFFQLIKEDEITPFLQIWSTDTFEHFHSSKAEEMHKPADQAGVWAEAIRQRRSVIHNDYASLPGRNGLPQDHVPLVRELLVPIIRSEKIVALIGIGNKAQEYTHDDLEITSRFADYAWDIIERKQIMIELAEERNQLAKRVEERTSDLSRANSNLARALRVKDEFLANMSHELRTPLNAILGLSESLTEQTAGPLNEKQQRYLTTISESGHHLLSLINDILDLAKIEAGQITLDINKMDVNVVSQASLRMIKQQAQKKNLDVSVEIDPEVGWIWADERRLKQMIVNLLSNAVKFTPEGGKIGLQIVGHSEDNKVAISVWDTGIGIKETDFNRLFQPFVQLDAGLARESSGTGLGLALVAQMARLHAGSIHLESEPGKGSRFTIILPWQPALAMDTVERMKTTGKFLPIRPGQAQETVLLIEDTQEVVMTIKDYLEMAGYKVVTAQDGMDGITQAKISHPNIILMDVQMPRMDGLEATRRLRQDPEFKTTPIIALTALAMPSDRERCLAAGMNEYVSKPVNLRGLVKLIQTSLFEQEEKSKTQ